MMGAGRIYGDYIVGFCEKFKTLHKNLLNIMSVNPGM